MLSNATNQPKSTVELGYMCPRGLTGPPAKWAIQLENLRLGEKFSIELFFTQNYFKLELFFSLVKWGELVV